MIQHYRVGQLMNRIKNQTIITAGKNLAPLADSLPVETIREGGHHE